MQSSGAEVHWSPWTAARTAAAQLVAGDPKGLAPIPFHGWIPKDSHALLGNNSLLLGQDGSTPNAIQHTHGASTAAAKAGFSPEKIMDLG